MRLLALAVAMTIAFPAHAQDPVSDTPYAVCLTPDQAIKVSSKLAYQEAQLEELKKSAGGVAPGLVVVIAVGSALLAGSVTAAVAVAATSAKK